MNPATENRIYHQEMLERRRNSNYADTLSEIERVFVILFYFNIYLQSARIKDWDEANKYLKINRGSDFAISLSKKEKELRSNLFSDKYEKHSPYNYENVYHLHFFNISY